MGDFFKGLVGGAVDMGKGILTMVFHPIKTLKAFGALATGLIKSPGATVSALVHNIVAPYQQAIQSGHMGEAIGRGFFDAVMVTIGPVKLFQYGRRFFEDSLNGLGSVVQGGINGAAGLGRGLFSNGSYYGGAMMNGAGQMVGGAMQDVGGAMGGMMAPGAMGGGMMAPPMVGGGMMAPGAMAGGMMAPGAMAGGMMDPAAMAAGGMMAPGAMAGGMMAPGAMAGGMMAPGAMAGGMMAPGAMAGGMMAPGAMAGGALVAGASPALDAGLVDASRMGNAAALSQMYGAGALGDKAAIQVLGDAAKLGHPQAVSALQTLATNGDPQVASLVGSARLGDAGSIQNLANLAAQGHPNALASMFDPVIARQASRNALAAAIGNGAMTAAQRAKVVHELSKLPTGTLSAAIQNPTTLAASGFNPALAQVVAASPEAKAILQDALTKASAGGAGDAGAAAVGSTPVGAATGVGQAGTGTAAGAATGGANATGAAAGGVADAGSVVGGTLPPVAQIEFWVGLPRRTVMDRLAKAADQIGQRAGVMRKFGATQAADDLQVYASRLRTASTQVRFGDVDGARATVTAANTDAGAASALQAARNFLGAPVASI